MTDEVKEYVYCMSNPMYPKDIFKIGCTKNNPMLRANHLFTTGVPTPFKIEFIITTKNSKGLEKQIHNYISNYRLCDKREFFQISMDKLIEILQNELHIEIITDLLHFSNNNNNNIHIRKPINTSPKKIAKTDFNFKCDACKYKCKYIRDWNIHISRIKHKNNATTIVSSKMNNNTCLCGKEYKTISGLWKHTKKCDKKSLNTNKSITVTDELNNNESNNNEIWKQTIMNLVKNNHDLQKEHITLQKQLIDICNKKHDYISK